MAIRSIEGLPPALAYARLLHENHALIAAGRGDTDEAEVLADRMDAPWYAMTDKEQDRLGGLSEDLYSIADGGPNRIDLSPEATEAWRQQLQAEYERAEAGDADPLLELLRKPIPRSVPADAVRFLQARCWERLGDLETALTFLREAERLNPTHASSVLTLLAKMGDSRAAANQVLRLLTMPLPASA
jgi:hypothetical protein